jgi:hypothetical protein
MLPEDVMPCICGAKKWRFGGGTLSASFSHESFVCGRCGQPVWILTGYGCGPLALFHMKDATLAVERWVNGPMMAQWRLTWDKHANKDMSRPITPTPPALPLGVVGYIKRADDEWEGPYNAENTKHVQAPEDPILTRHKKYWSELLAELGIEEYTPIKNRYSGSELEPWYKFTLHGAKVVVGPRKRVDVIEVSCSPPFECPELDAVTKKDDVTFYDTTGGLGVHAWSKEKFIEYFRIIERCLGVPNYEI